MKYAKSFVLSYAGTIGPRIIRPLVMIVLARLLTPDDFGIIAIGFAMIMLLQIFKDFGLGQVIIQSQKSDTVKIAFSLQLLISVILFALMQIIAQPLAMLYSEPLLPPVIRVMSINLLLLPFIDIPVFDGMREVKFGPYSIRNTVEPTVEGLISICLALMGGSYWSLIVGYISGQVTCAVLFIFYIGFRPKLCNPFSKSERKHLVFGSHIVIQGLLGWLQNSSDKLVLRSFSGNGEVGNLEVCRQVSRLPFQLILMPIVQVTYPLMSKAHHAGQNVGKLYLTYLRRIIVITIPFYALIYANSEEFVRLVLGQNWIVITPALQYYCIIMFCACFVSMNQQALRAIGKPDLLTKFMIIRSCATLPSYIIASPYGFVALSAVRALLAGLFTPINSYLVINSLRISLLSFWRALWPGLSLLGILVIIFYQSRILFNNQLILVVNIIGTLVVLIIYCFIFELELISALINRLKTTLLLEKK